jgi:hypothetical protein
MKPKSANTVNIVPKNLKYHIGFSPNLKEVTLFITNSIGLGKRFSTQKVLIFPLKNKTLEGPKVSI